MAKKKKAEETPVQETENAVQETENAVQETENVVQETENVVQETENVVQETENVVQEQEIPVQETETPVQEKDNPENILNDTLNKFSEPKNEVHEATPVVNENLNTAVEKVDIKLSDFITGYTLLVIYDRIYPKLLKYILRLLFKIEIPQVGLDEDEAAILEPIADKIAEQMTVKVNPFIALFVLSNIFYMNKLDEAGAFDSQPKQLKAKTSKGKSKRGRPRKIQNHVEQIKGE